MQGWVIFESEAAFNTAHEAAKTAAGLPIVGEVNGTPAPQNQQTTEITSCTAHPSSSTVVAYINGGWPEELKAGLEFKTAAEVSAYFPPEVL